jgi:hypothetical protein
MTHFDDNPDHGGATSTDGQGNVVFLVCHECGYTEGNIPNHVAADYGLAERFDPSKPIPPKATS